MARKAVIPDKKVDASLDAVADSNAHQKAQESKRDEKFNKEMMYGQSAYKRTVHDTAAERDARYARLHDFGHNKQVEMMWDFQPEAIRNQVFKLKVGKEEVYLSAAELQKYLRWV